MAKGCNSIIFHRFYKGKQLLLLGVCLLNMNAPPKEVYSKKEETFSHRTATSILYDLNLRLEVK